ncbi:ferrochelatase [Alcanivorax sp.]|jgi:ferrochelatase|uniref:ferrochelatase n=1 Tax=Alcanivorax sp. TaxID=1872427 RepID=UPI0032D92C52
MAYKGQENLEHLNPRKIGVLITNLGTPDAPETGALRRYLREFLSDPRVVEIPRFIWFFILNLVILVIRPRKSAEAYKSVWTQEGSPLLVYSLAQGEGIRQRLQSKYGDDVGVRVAMRYGNPSIASQLQAFENEGIRKLIVLPLYPQYSGSTNGSTFDAVAQDFMARRLLPDLRFISHYPDYPPYIQAMADHIRAYREKNGSADKLIFSFHGVPKRFLLKGDPYFHECHQTSQLLAEALGLSDGQWMITFQSRFGAEEWLQPYTDVTMKSLPGEGVKSVQVFCPGFSADCLETVEEIDEENRGYFEQAGGESFAYISAMNAEPVHLDALARLIEDNLQGWR